MWRTTKELSQEPISRSQIDGSDGAVLASPPVEATVIMEQKWVFSIVSTQIPDS